MEKLATFGLNLNKEKSQILKGPQTIEGLEDVSGIPIVQKVKYLGFRIASTKTMILQDLRKEIKKHTRMIRAKIRTENKEVQKVL